MHSSGGIRLAIRLTCLLALAVTGAAADELPEGFKPRMKGPTPYDERINKLLEEQEHRMPVTDP